MRMAESAGYKRILVSDNEAHFQWPLWMNGIPHKSLLRIKENFKRSLTFGGNDILTKENYYIIRTKDFSIEDNQSYHAYKVTVSPSVHCDCLNFRSYPELPCKHLLAVIRETNVEWADLPLSFRHNPRLCADPDPGASCSTQEVLAVQLDDGLLHSNLHTTFEGPPQLFPIRITEPDRWSQNWRVEIHSWNTCFGKCNRSCWEWIYVLCGEKRSNWKWTLSNSDDFHKMFKIPRPALNHGCPSFTAWSWKLVAWATRAYDRLVLWWYLYNCNMYM